MFIFFVIRIMFPNGNYVDFEFKPVFHLKTWGNGMLTQKSGKIMENSFFLEKSWNLDFSTFIMEKSWSF